jgi:hypothetical protein
MDVGSPSFKAEYYRLNTDPVATPYSRRDFYKIWLIENEGSLIVGSESLAIRKPAIVFLNPLEPYAFKPVAKQRTGYWCIFTEAFASTQGISAILQETPLFKLGSNAVFYPDERRLQAFRFFFEQLIDNYNSTYVFKYQSIKCHIVLLINEAMKLAPGQPRPPRYNAAARLTSLFLHLLEKQFPITSPKQSLKLKKPGDFAGELAVHVNHLNAVVHEVTGKPTSKHIAERILREGQALLRFSD